MGGSLLFAPQGSCVVFEQFGIRRAVRMAAQRRGVSSHGAERAALDSLAAHGDRSRAMEAGFQHLESIDCSREITA